MQISGMEIYFSILQNSKIKYITELAKSYSLPEHENRDVDQIKLDNLFLCCQFLFLYSYCLFIC